MTNVQSPAIRFVIDNLLIIKIKIGHAYASSLKHVVFNILHLHSNAVCIPPIKKQGFRSTLCEYYSIKVFHGPFCHSQFKVLSLERSHVFETDLQENGEMSYSSGDLKQARISLTDVKENSS